MTIAKTPEITEAVLEGLAKGRSLRAVCASLGFSSQVVLRWVEADADGFREQYVRAREAQADHHADELVEIADAEPRLITTETLDAEGRVQKRTERIDPAWVAQQQLKSDNRKWVAAKMRPKVYGNKIDVTGSLKLDIGRKLNAARQRAIEGAVADGAALAEE